MSWGGWEERVRKNRLKNSKKDAPSGHVTLRFARKGAGVVRRAFGHERGSVLTSLTGVPYEALKFMLSCLTKNMSLMPCDPGAGVDEGEGVENDGVELTRFIGERHSSVVCRGLALEFGVMATRPVNAAPRFATCVRRSAKDNDIALEVSLDVNCGGVEGSTVVSRVSPTSRASPSKRFFLTSKRCSPTMVRPANVLFGRSRSSRRVCIACVAQITRTVNAMCLGNCRGGRARVCVGTARRHPRKRLKRRACAKNP